MPGRSRWTGTQTALFLSLLFIAIIGLYMPAAADNTAAPKRRVAVESLRCRGPVRRFSTREVENGLSRMLIEALMGTGRIAVTDRVIAGELSDNVHAPLLIGGAITEFEPSILGEEWRYGPRLSPHGGTLGPDVSLKDLQARVEIKVTVIDTAAGTVLACIDAAGKSRSGGVRVDAYRPDMPFGSDLFHRRPIGRACRKTVDKAVSKLLGVIDDGGWSAEVIAVIGGKVYLDAGSLNGLDPGITFVLRHRENEVVDPETGEPIGAVDHRLGTIVIETVERRYAVGRLVEGDLPRRGDLVTEK